LERCFRPVMASATFAERRLSTAPRRVKENAEGKTWSNRGETWMANVGQADFVAGRQTGFR
jgi:hypothetical protein